MSGDNGPPARDGGKQSQEGAPANTTPRSTHHHVFPVSANLLGIALLIISGLHVTGAARGSLADEVAWVAVFALGVSCLMSYLAVRRDAGIGHLARWADLVFMGGLTVLLASVAVLAYDSV